MIAVSDEGRIDIVIASNALPGEIGPCHEGQPRSGGWTRHNRQREPASTTQRLTAGRA
jgi:hypothetical protein